MKKHKIAVIFYSSLFVLIMLVGIGVVYATKSKGTTSKSAVNSKHDVGLETPYTIVTTVSILADTTRNITGNYAKVTELMGPGVDPHLYLPARSDILQISNADMVFYIGMLLEGQLSNTLDSLHRAGRRVYPLIEALDPASLIFPASTQHADPHVWMDISLWMHITDVITEQVIAFDPARAKYYTENKEQYKQKLRNLEEFARLSLETVENRILVTAHDAFNYFGRAYNFDVIGIQGISTESEAGIAEINNLIALIIENKVPAIFFESTVADKYVKALVEGTRSQGFVLRIGGELYSDALGEYGTKESSYLGMLEANIRRITIGLGGEPASGYGE